MRNQAGYTRGTRPRNAFPWAIAVIGLLCVIFPASAIGTPQATQDVSNGATPAAVEHVKLLMDKGSPALEITTTEPVNPQISKLKDGLHLLIDLPNTSMSVAGKTLPIKHPDLSELRLNRSNTTPPMVHVEVDFRRPLSYSWSSAGNRLLISFHDPSKGDTAPSEEASSLTAAGGENASVVPISAPADVPDLSYVVPAERLASGASITADTETTVLRLKRTGDIYICPQTTVSVVHSQNGPDTMLALNDGGLETHLALQKSADEVVTPDFRILLRGPGEFHYAIRADSRGNTCVKTLPGNTASAIIYELMGDGTYDVQAHDQLVFHNGKLNASSTHSANGDDSVLPVECGCPPPARPTLLTTRRADPLMGVESAAPVAPAPAEGNSTPAPDPSKTAAGMGSPVSSESAAEVAALPQQQPGHVNVEASLTFTPNPARMAASHLPATSREMEAPVSVMPPSPPPTTQPAENHKSMFGKLKSFFSRVF